MLSGYANSIREHAGQVYFLLQSQHYSALQAGLFLGGCDSRPQSASASPSVAAPIKPAEKPASPSRWKISTSANEVTNQITITAVNDSFGSESLIVRLVGKKLDCYVATEQFLETIENLDTRRSTVKYKFDDGNVVRQAWVISNDNTALFAPASTVKEFIRKMSKAKRFSIEYSPAHLVPQTASFNVAEFPSELIDALGERGAARPKAAREKE